MGKSKGRWADEKWWQRAWEEEGGEGGTGHLSWPTWCGRSR